MTNETNVPPTTNGALVKWITRARELTAADTAAAAELATITIHAARPVTRVAVTSMSTRQRHPVLIQMVGDACQPDGSDESPKIYTAADLGVELTGVPAPDGGDAEADAARWASLAAADAVVMVVHGTAPMTMAEVGVTAELLQRGFAPEQVRIVVSRIDLVDLTDQVAVLDYVSQRAQAIAPGLTVWPAGPDASDTAGAAVRGWIVGEVLPAASGRRDKQIAQQLTRLLAAVGHRASHAAKAAERMLLQQDEETAALTEARADELLRFDEVRENVRERRNVTVAAFGSDRDKFQRDLETLLDHQLEKSQDPARWWHEELPYQLQTRFTAWDQRMCAVLQDRVGTDARILQSELGPLTDANLRGVDPLDIPKLTLRPADQGKADSGFPGNPGLSADTMHKHRVKYNLVPTITALGAIVAFPPLAPVAVLSAVLARMGLMELRLPALAREQRAEIRPQFASLLNATLNEHADAVRAAITRAYQQQENDVGWLREQRRTAETKEQGSGPEAGTDVTHWPTLIADCAALADGIRSAAEEETARPGSENVQNQEGTGHAG